MVMQEKIIYYFWDEKKKDSVMKDISIILDEIYSLIQNQSDIAFPEFGFRRKCNGWEATCGKLNGVKAKGHLYHYDNSPFCFKNHKTDETIAVWNYVRDTKGLSEQETIKELARLVNYTLPELTGYSEEKAKEIIEQATLLEKALDYFKYKLWTDQGKKALNYLKGKRGYTETEIKAMELGFYPSQKDVEAYLVKKTYSKEAIKEAGLKTGGFGKTHKVVIAHRGRVGRIKGFIVRAIENKTEPKYLYLKGMRRDTLFNFNEARRNETLIVTEGYLDALIATQRGIKGVVATGGSSITKNQLEDAIKHKVKSFILALDNDESGKDGGERSIKLINKKGLKSYVITLPEGYKDPDELIRAKGIEAFKKVIKEAKSCTKWKAERILDRYDLETDRGERAALDEAIAFEEKIRNPYEREKFKGVIRERLDISESILNDLTEEFHKKKAEDRQRKKSERFLSEALRQVREGTEIINVIKTVDEKTRELKTEFEKIREESSSITFEKYLEGKYQRDSRREKGELLGYKLNKFKEIANKLEGIQPGFYIIGGETDIGKTAFATNLFLDLLDSNSKTKGIYFSLDDNKDVITGRLVSILTRFEINEVKRKQESVAKGKKIVEVYEKLKDYARNGRLDIKDLSEINHINNLETEIRKRAGDNLFVAIDGLYNLEIGKSYSGIREENIERAQKVKSLVDIYRLPIICTGELRKRTPSQSQKKTPTRDDLMETGKFAYNATVIWLLYPENIEQFEETPEPMLRLKFEKNKLSSFTGCQKLKFIKAKGIIKEDI